ncbi:hypothetical protein Catovirus_1_453 [Catovirus CTV1]|uniref:C2H2-type domain-containing protein n=1 Tax=Catovirus CTV1 TaxID=1977631 RepID=A0A1V0S9M8_9VIRU|nr:hypothetical protein Catovirus_1_453 [Catovirus CTV1]
MNYKCDICNYETSDRGNYYKHKKTKKHIEKSNKLNVSSNQEQSDNSPKHPKDTPKFICRYCNNSFTRSYTLSCHYKICTFKKNSDDAERADKSNKIKILENKIKFIEKEKKLLVKQSEEKIRSVEKISEDKLRMLEKQNSLLEKENEYHKQLVISAGNMIQSSMSTLNHLILNYNNAPLLEPIKDYSVLEDKNKFINSLVYYQKENKLNQYIGDFLLKHYKTENPKNRSNWNSDTSRLTYINRELVNNQPNWVIDKKGVKMTNIVIDPFLNYIKKILQEEFNFLKDNINVNDDTIKKMFILSDILKNINDKTLSMDVNRYLAPHLYFEKN